MTSGSSPSPTRFTEAALREKLYPRPFRFLPQAGSTNDLAMAWATENAPSGAVVVTDEQLSGRGRFARPWVAPAGTALLFSVILRPLLPADRLYRMAMVGAVALRDVLEPLALGRIAYKWPNDVQLDGRKLAGILPEARWDGNRLTAVILGIGLNVSVPFENTALAHTAISLTEAVATPIDRAQVLAQILPRIDYWSVRVDDRALWESWRAGLATIGQQITVRFNDGQTLMGLAADVDEDGALQLRDNEGTIHHLLAGEVTMTPPP